jgi:hypothetical protein
MRIRVIRTIRRTPVGPDASSIQLRLDVAARPYPAPRVLCIALDPCIFALASGLPASTDGSNRDIGFLSVDKNKDERGARHEG